MKHLKFILPLILCSLALVIGSCEKEQTESTSNELLTTKSLSEDAGDQADILQERKTRSIPFRARLSTFLTPDRLDEVDCLYPDLYSAPNFQEGSGNGTHLGAFDAELTFCSGAGGTYGGGTGYLEAANGDRLYITIDAGQVIIPLPEPDPVYDAYFQDPFEFSGGTGRFEDASGHGMTNSLVDLWNDEYPFPGPIIPNHRTDHVWEGVLILPNG